MSEKYYGFSPYCYCAGEPVTFIDPDGNQPIVGALLGAAVEYGFQVYENYNNGLSGLDALFRNIDFADVALSAINPAGKLKLFGTLGVNMAKEFINYQPKDGFSVSYNVEESITSAGINTVIDLGVDKVVSKAKAAAQKQSDIAGGLIEDAGHKRKLSNARNNPIQHEKRALQAEAAVQPAINTAEAYNVTYNVINDFQEPLKIGLAITYDNKKKEE